jgi:hypothetical protein
MGAAIAWGNILTNPALTFTASLASSAQMTSIAFDSAYPATNALDPDPSKFTRINFVRNAVAGGYVFAYWQFSTTLAGQQSARALCAVNLRIPSNATQVTVKAYDYTGAGVFEQVYLAADLVPIPGTTDRYTLPAVHTAAVNIASVGVLVFLPVSTSGYVEIGHLWGSPALVLEGTDNAWQQAPVDGSLVDRADSGAHLADVRNVRDVFRAGLPRLTTTEAYGAAGSTAPSLRRLQFEAGRHDPVLFLGRTSSTFWLQVQAYYGALRQVPAIRHADGEKYDSEIEIEQIT